jgi:hypothetical protein
MQAIGSHKPDLFTALASSFVWLRYYKRSGKGTNTNPDGHSDA